MSRGFGAHARLALLATALIGAAAMLPANPSAAQSTAEEETFAPVNRRIESSDLSPMELPGDLWRGMDAAAVAKWLATQNAPPSSPALAQLWRRLMTSAAPPATDKQVAVDLQHLRLEALYRAGLLTEIADALNKGSAHGAAGQVWRARVNIGLGEREKGCQALTGPVDAEMAKAVRAEKQLLIAYCAAVAGDTAAAALAAGLAREEGSTAEPALTILETLDGGVEKRPPLPGRISVLDYRFLELTGPVDGTQAVQKAEPALLVALAGSSALDAKVQIAAAEAALRRNVMTPEAVATIYRRLPSPAKGTRANDPALERAHLFRAMEDTQAPDARARLLRTLLDDARRAGVLQQTAAMLSPIFSNLWPEPETRPLAEALVQIALASGELELARRWAESATNLQHWLALIDIADPQAQRGQRSGLAALGDLAKRGRLPPAALQRTVTVLDALGIEVPLLLWEAAGRAAQSPGGRMPATGVLTELVQASQQKQAARTIVLTIEAIGPDGPEGANALALVDSLRALKRAGLEADARRLAVEALLAMWPRASGS